MGKYFSFLLFFLCFIGVETAFSQYTQTDFDAMLDDLLSHSVVEVSSVECKDQPVVYLDAREWKEYSVSHLPNAVWVGYNDFDIDRVSDISKHARIVVYCTVGYRSEKIAEQLETAGFSSVYNLRGGIFDWYHAQGVLLNEKGDTTHRVHTYDRDWGKWLRSGTKVVR